MEPFARTVESWHDFYIMIGTASATLVGLLFLSLSLNAEAITGQANYGARILAAQAFANFLSVVLFAVLFLIPNQGPLGLGLPLAGIGLLGLINTLRRIIEARKAGARIWEIGSVASRLAGSALCYVALLAVAASVVLGRGLSLYWLVPVMVLLIVEASRNAWNLLVMPRDHRTETQSVDLVGSSKADVVPNQLPDPASPSVTPAAGAAGAPSVAADH